MRPSRTIGFMLILVILMSVCIPCKISAYDGDLLSCWYSDENSVGLWTSTPSFSYETLSAPASNFSYQLSSAYTYAWLKWKQGGKNTVYYGSTTGEGNIHCIGGTYDEIYAQTNYQVNPRYTAVTASYSSFLSYLNYNGATKILRTMHPGVRIYFAQQNYNDSEATRLYRNTMMHELGHALGWFGHGPSGSVMFFCTTTVVELSSKDKDHINQIY